MPLIQWIMQNLGMGLPRFHSQGSGSLSFSNNVEVKPSSAFTYIPEGGLKLLEDAGLIISPSFQYTGSGNIVVGGESLFFYRKSLVQIKVITKHYGACEVDAGYLHDLLIKLDDVKDEPSIPNVNIGMAVEEILVPNKRVATKDCVIKTSAKNIKYKLAALESQPIQADAMPGIGIVRERK